MSAYLRFPVQNISFFQPAFSKRFWRVGCFAGRNRLSDSQRQENVMGPIERRRSKISRRWLSELLATRFWEGCKQFLLLLHKKTLFWPSVGPCGTSFHFRTEHIKKLCETSKTELLKCCLYQPKSYFIIESVYPLLLCWEKHGYIR